MKAIEIEIQETAITSPSTESPVAIKLMRCGRHWHFSNVHLPVDNCFSTVLEGVAGDHLEILARFAPNKSHDFGVNVLLDPDFPSAPEISYNRRLQRFGELKLPLSHRDALSGHILVAGNVIEYCANDTVRAKQIVDGLSSGATRVGLFCWGGPVTVSSIDVWEVGLSETYAIGK